MDFSELVHARFSVRKFSDKPVEHEVLLRILEAGRVAPTAHNNQPQRILVIESADALARFRKCTVCHFDAPLALLICADKDECWKRKYDGKASGDIDAAIVTTHLMLAAAAEGVGSTWVMHFIPEAVRTEFALPDNLEPVALLPMGYPAPDAAPYPGHLEKKPIDATVSFNDF